MSTDFSCVLKWFLCYFSNQQTEEIATHGCDSNSVKDVDFSENISENQRSWSHLLKKFLMENFIFCAVFIDFVQFSVYSMCDSRMCILKFITCDCLTHIRHRFPYMGHMGKIYLEMGIFPPANSVFKLKRVKKSSFFFQVFH